MGELPKAMSISMPALLIGNQSRSDNVTKPRITPEGVILKLLRHTCLLVVLLRVLFSSALYVYYSSPKSCC